ncbi:MAG: hypothetical protein MUF56_06345 [Solirubrobacteraceae bacterium]|nr:hypothetical protein [Solirubrobacteraceae bacterium]
MRGVARFAPRAVTPDPAAVLLRAGIPAGVSPSARTRRLLDDAQRLFEALADPRGVVAELPAAAFAAVYRGDGGPGERTALDGVLPRAEAVALFAATLGQPLCARIGALVGGEDPPLGFVLDALASEAADGLSWRLGAAWRARRAAAGRSGAGTLVVPYSPGYCGWPVLGQRALFRALAPDTAGITLNESCLMAPLKSVSGALVAAPREAHRIQPDFPACAACATHECRARALEWPAPGLAASAVGGEEIAWSH